MSARSSACARVFARSLLFMLSRRVDEALGARPSMRSIADGSSAPAIGGSGGWTSGRPEPEAAREACVPGPSPTGEWVASTTTHRNAMGGHSTHPRMALEIPLKGGSRRPPDSLEYKTND